MHMRERMVGLAAERHMRALARAESAHPGKIVTFPMTFKDFTKAPCRDGSFYFLAPRGHGRHQAHQGALGDDLDEADLSPGDEGESESDEY